jgi:hypothetical protein
MLKDNYFKPERIESDGCHLDYVGKAPGKTTPAKS